VREEYYQETGTGLNYNDCAQDLTDRLKVAHSWLKDADSQTFCGEKHPSLTLNIRQWVCTNCGVIHDRAQWAPENAAINILNKTTGGAPESHADGYMIGVG
jgi:hypothetical protein